MAILIGIDLGTTHVKVGAYTPRGELVALARERTPVVTSESGWAEHPPDALWHVVADGLKRVAGTLPAGAGPVRAIGVAGMAEAGLLIERNGKPLTPAYAWYDRRAEGYVARWRRDAMAAELFRTTGIPPSAKCPVVKLEWVRDHLPRALERAWKWLHVPDYIAYRLTGAAGTDFSLAGRTMAFDIHRKAWCEWILASAGLDAALWPVPRPAAEPVGSLLESVAQEVGLPTGIAGIPVVVAGHDHLCGAAAVGAVESGGAVDSLGTAESLISVRERLPAAEMHAGDGYNYGCHVVPDTYYILGAFSGSGATLEWWMDRLGAPAGEGRYDWLVARLDEAPPGPTGVVHLPYLRGSGPPQKDPAARGVLFGIGENLTIPVWLKAVLEGLCAESRRILDGMALPPDTPVTVIGGGTSNPHWLQIKADILGRILVVPGANEAVAQGAAMLAGVAAGLFESAREGAKAMAPPARVIRPDPGTSERYDRWYRSVYLTAWRAHREVEEAQAAFAAGDAPS